MLLRYFFCLFVGVIGVSLSAFAEDYEVRGRVIDKLSRLPIPYANVALYGHPGKGASTDTAGVFCIEHGYP